MCTQRKQASKVLARLIGLQYYAETAAAVGVADGDGATAVDYLEKLFSGMGDSVVRLPGEAGLRQESVRIARGLEGVDRAVVVHCWQELFRGALASRRDRLAVGVEVDGEGLLWRL